MSSIHLLLGRVLCSLFDVGAVKVAEHAHETRDRRLTRPVALQLAVHLYPTDELCATHLSVYAALIVTCLIEQFPGDHQSLDFARAFDDLQYFGFA